MKRRWSKVEPEEFAELEERFAEAGPTFEYLAQYKEVVVLAPPTPIHQLLQSVLEGCQSVYLHQRLR